MTGATAKALTIRQPWAWLIVNGYKPVENRSWNTRHRGLFQVHAGKAIDPHGYNWVKANYPEIPLPPASELCYGGIVGTAEVVDVLPPGSDAPQLGAWYLGQFGFVLANAAPAPFRQLPGKLGFFDAP